MIGELIEHDISHDYLLQISDTTSLILFKRKMIVMTINKRIEFFLINYKKQYKLVDNIKLTK